MYSNGFAFMAFRFLAAIFVPLLGFPMFPLNVVRTKLELNVIIFDEKFNTEDNVC